MRARTEPSRKVSCQSAYCRATLFGGSGEKCFAFRSRSVDGTEYVTALRIKPRVANAAPHSMPAPCIPVVVAMNADAVLLYSPCARFGRGTLLEALSTMTKLLALCGPGRWQKHRARAGSIRPLLGWKLRAESGAPKQARKESGALATVPEERTRQRNNEQS